MTDWIAMPPETILVIAVKTLGMYVALITLTRLAGLRSFSKMSGFDFAVTVAIGSVLASVILAKDPPLLQGGFVLLSLFSLQMTLAWARKRFPAVETLTSNAPRLIMVGENVLSDQMRKAKISEADLYAKLREANVLSLGQVEAVIAETTGDVSVLHRGPNAPPLDPALLLGVVGAERFGGR